jgi:hypothetical protein
MITTPTYLAYKRECLEAEKREEREMIESRYRIKGVGLPMAEIRCVPADRQLGHAFGSKLEVVRLN